MRPRGADPALRLMRTIDGQRWRLGLAAVLAALAVGSSVGLLATSAYLISRAAQQPPILYLQVAIVGVRAFGIGRGVFRYAERLTGHDAAFRGLAGLRVRLYLRLEVLAPAGLLRWRRGDLLTRLVDDVDSALDLQLRVLLPFATALLVGTGSVLLAWAMLPLAGMVLAAALLIGAIAVPAATVWAGAADQRRTAPARAQLAADVVTAVESSADLLALQAAPQALDRVRRADARTTALARRSALVLGIGTGLGVAAQGLAVVGSLLAGAAAVAEGRMPGVLLAVVALLPLAAYEAVQSLPGAVLTLHRVRSAARRVFEVADQAAPCEDPAQPRSLPPGPCTLVARGLSVTWPGAAAPAVADVDLDLAPGRSIAVVGPSGSGKSSLAMGLLGFLPHRGSLDLAGVPYRELAGDTVRTVVGMLAQDAHIFDTSIGENLRLARRDASDAELASALHKAGLGAWVDGLPDGLATPVGRHGARISGGQRQRLALARLLLGEHRIVVLDEPTEHLQPVEADRVLGDCLDALQGRGLLLITHDVRQAMRCQEVLVVVAGRVAERGEPGELATAGGAFARLLAGAA